MVEPSDASQFEREDSLDYETCAVVSDSKGSLWWTRYFFRAQATGPNGSYAAATSAQFDQPPVDKFDQQNHAAMAPLEGLLRQLSTAGWEPVGSGPEWFGRQLRRPVAVPSANGAVTVMLA